MILLLSYKVAHDLNRPPPGSRPSEEFAMGLKEPVGYSAIWLNWRAVDDVRSKRPTAPCYFLSPSLPRMLWNSLPGFSLRLGSLGLWVEEKAVIHPQAIGSWQEKSIVTGKTLEKGSFLRKLFMVTFKFLLILWLYAVLFLYLFSLTLNDCIPVHTEALYLSANVFSTKVLILD